MKAHLLDKCPISSWEEVRQVVAEDLGAPPEQLFASFAHTPIASASLAQVRPHAAVPLHCLHTATATAARAGGHVCLA